MIFCQGCGDPVIRVWGRQVCACRVDERTGMNSRYEYTPEEEQSIVDDCLFSLAIWEKIFAFKGGVSFVPRPYDVKREEQHES